LQKELLFLCCGTIVTDLYCRLKKRVLEGGDERETKTANDLTATLILSIEM